MYQEFYRLKENPFNVTADPDFFFASKSHMQAISSLLFGIDQRKGILVITGEVGTGKTTLCRKLLREAGEKNKFAFILNPKFSALQLMKLIAQDLGLSGAFKNKISLTDALNAFLLTETRQGNNVILIIDEAQNLTVSQLEQIRLLSNLETEKEKLLQIVLVGQPELLKKLQLDALRQIRQRVAIYYHLMPLAKADVVSYVQHRLTKAINDLSLHRPIQFTTQAIESIYHFTEGYPRAINILCDRALMAGFVAETFAIDEYIIQSCAKEVICLEHHL